MRTLSPCTNTTPTSQAPGTNKLNTPDELLSKFTATWPTKTNFGGVFGLAKDGHVIYGPYNEFGEVWQCDDLDFCNGFFLPDATYGYASTAYWPYTVGCWGPA